MGILLDLCWSMSQSKRPLNSTRGVTKSLFNQKMFIPPLEETASASSFWCQSFQESSAVVYLWPQQRTSCIEQHSGRTARMQNLYRFQQVWYKQKTKTLPLFNFFFFFIFFFLSEIKVWIFVSVYALTSPSFIGLWVRTMCTRTLKAQNTYTPHLNEPMRAII